MDPKLTGAVSLSLGAAFQGLFDQVNSTIQQAASEFKDAAIEAEIEAGREINFAIENAKNAYKDALNETLDKVQSATKIAFDNLKSMVESFQKRNLEELGDLKLRAQQFILSLPFSSKQPQLTTVKPREVVIDDIGRSSLITFQGVFPWSADPKHPPVLNFGERVCPLIDSNTQALTFEVPHRVFGEAKANQYSFVSGKLQVPWNDKGWIFDGWTEFAYQVGLGCLPLLAGTLTAEYLSNHELHLSQHVVSPEVTYNGNTWYPQKWHEVLESFYPHSGWKIDMTTKPRLIVTHVHGDHRQEILSVTPDRIVVKTSLYCKSGSEIGIVKIKVEFDEVQDQKVQNKRTETFSINWKDSKLLEPKEGETINKVAFDAYTGTHEEFGGPDQSRPVIKISADGSGKWKVWAEIPSDLKARFAALPMAMQSEREKPQHLLSEENLRRIIEGNRTRAQLASKAIEPAKAAEKQ